MNLPDGLTKLWSRKLAICGPTILAMVEAGEWTTAAAVAVGYALSVGLTEAAEALGAAKLLGNVHAGLDLGLPANEAILDAD